MSWLLQLINASTHLPKTFFARWLRLNRQNIRTLLFYHINTHNKAEWQNNNFLWQKWLICVFDKNKIRINLTRMSHVVSSTIQDNGQKIHWVKVTTRGVFTIIMHICYSLFPPFRVCKTFPCVCIINVTTYFIN